MFIWWLAKRAWQSIVEYWNRAEVGERKISGKQDIYENLVISAWVGGLVASVFLAFYRGNANYLVFAVVIFVSIFPTLCAPDAYKYLSKLHSEYRAESGDFEGEDEDE